MRRGTVLMLRFCQLGGGLFSFLKGLSKFFGGEGISFGGEGGGLREGLHLGGDCDMVSVMTSVGW